MPQPAAFIGSTVFCPACLHFPDGVTPVPIPVTGSFVQGSLKVMAQGAPWVGVDDRGVHAACLGPNTFTGKTGSLKVFIDSNTKAACRVGDTTQHCGGVAPFAPIPLGGLAGSSVGTIFTGAMKIIVG